MSSDRSLKTRVLPAIGGDVLDLDDVLHGCGSYLDLEYAATVRAVMDAAYPPGRARLPYLGVDEHARVEPSIRHIHDLYAACHLQPVADRLATERFIEPAGWIVRQDPDQQ